MTRPRLQIYLDQEVRERLELAAKSRKLSIQDWAASVLQLEADRILDGKIHPDLIEKFVSDVLERIAHHEPPPPIYP